MNRSALAVTIALSVALIAVLVASAQPTRELVITPGWPIGTGDTPEGLLYDDDILSACSISAPVNTCRAVLMFSQPVTVSSIVYNIVSGNTSACFYYLDGNGNWYHAVSGAGCQNAGSGIQTKSTNVESVWGIGVSFFDNVTISWLSYNSQHPYPPTATPTSFPTVSTATATTTPQPTTTPISGNRACITPTATSVLSATITPTPIGILRPGPTVTPTVSNDFVSGAHLFLGGLGDWTVWPYYCDDYPNSPSCTSRTSSTGWDSGKGHGGVLAGSAALGDYAVSSTDPDSSGEYGYTVVNADDALGHDMLALRLPTKRWPVDLGKLYVSGYAIVQNSQAGDVQPKIRAAYYDSRFDIGQIDPQFPDVLGPGAVIFQPNMLAEVGSSWVRFGIVLDPVTAYSPTLAFSETHYVDTILLEWIVGERGRNVKVLVDDIKIYSRVADFPVCAGGGGSTTGGGGGIGPFPGGDGRTKTCWVQIVDVDVMSDYCVAPASWLDIGQWINWAGCRIETYFAFIEQNTNQIVAIGDNLGDVEPIASMFDTPEVMRIVWETIDSIARLHTEENFMQTRTIDFEDLLDFTSISSPPNISEPVAYAPDVSQCDSVIIKHASELTQQTACWVVTVVHEKFTLIHVFQWMLDGICVIGLFNYVMGIFNSPSAA